MRREDTKDSEKKGDKVSQANSDHLVYRRLHLPVNARAQNMFSRDVKRLSFRRQTLKFSRPNVKFPL